MREEVRALPQASVQSGEGFLSIPLRSLPGYTVNDGSVADLDGERPTDIIIRRSGRGRDKSLADLTDPQVPRALPL